MNATQLHTDLAAAGLPVIGCDSLGNIQYSQELSSEEVTLAASILSNFTDPQLPIILWIHYIFSPKSGSTLLQADGVPLMRNLAQDVLTIRAEVHIADDPESQLIPQTSAWPIRLRYDNGAPAFIKICQPTEAGVYQLDINFAGKRPVRHMLFDDDFAQVTIAGVSYQFKQVIPLKIDVYEE